jgi:hypothetical protein
MIEPPGLYSAASRYEYFTVSARERKPEGDYQEKRGDRTMEDQSGKNLKKSRVFRVLLVFGEMIFIAFAVYMGLEIVRQVTWNETEGRVLDVRTWLMTTYSDGDALEYKVYTAIVDYYANGERYVSELDNEKREISVGETVAFLYDPKNPTDIVRKERWWWLAFWGFFIVFFGFGAVMLIIDALLPIRFKKGKGRERPPEYRRNYR